MILAWKKKCTVGANGCPLLSPDAHHPGDIWKGCGEESMADAIAEEGLLVFSEEDSAPHRPHKEE